jgi:hypothetical protein
MSTTTDRSDSARLAVLTIVQQVQQAQTVTAETINQPKLKNPCLALLLFDQDGFAPAPQHGGGRQVDKGEARILTPIWRERSSVGW